MAKHLDVEHQVEPEDGDQEAGTGGDDLGEEHGGEIISPWARRGRHSRKAMWFCPPTRPGCGGGHPPWPPALRLRLRPSSGQAPRLRLSALSASVTRMCSNGLFAAWRWAGRLGATSRAQ